MRKIISFVLLALFFTISACTTVHVHQHPKGKKHHRHTKVIVVDDKSGKHHAPGHRKKK